MMVRFKWRCKLCKQEPVSDTRQRHTMDVCDCGQSGVDAEEYYTRIMGGYEYIGDVEK